MRVYINFKKGLKLSSVMIFGIWCFTLIYALPAFGQQKKITAITSERWATLLPRALSALGNWTSYQINYEQGPDTLFLQSIRSGQTYVFPGCNNGRFISEHYFIALMPDARLHLLDLSSGKVKIIVDVKRYDLALAGKFIIALNQGYGQKSMLRVYTQDGNLLDSIKGVTGYKLNEKGTALVFAANASSCDQVGILHFEKYNNQLLPRNCMGRPLRFNWQDNGRSVTYLAELDMATKKLAVNFYNLDTRQYSQLDGAVDLELTKKGYELASRWPPEISDDGNFVKIALLKKETLLDKPDKVEIWNGNDDKLFAARQRSQPLAFARWAPQSGELSFISTDSLPDAMLNEKMSHALIFDTYAYGRIPAYYYKADYYLKDLSSGSMKLLLKAQSGAPGQVTFNPKGDKILYFSNKNWWVYDIQADKHLNITNSSSGLFDSESEDFAQTNVYGIAAWMDEAGSVLIYDRYDLWMVKLDGAGATRLTRGREHEMVYRISATESHDENGNYLGLPKVHFSLSKNILLDVKSQVDWSTGFASYNQKSGVRLLVFGALTYKDIKRAGAGFVYTAQKFDQPPRLVFNGSRGRKTKVLYQSNSHQLAFDQGKAQLVSYTNTDGDSLKAAIFYPAGYDAAKKYPMLVYIYEKVSKNLHEYVNVSSLNSDGFNVSNFTRNGYVVLMPDTRYRLGDPAVAATNCVISAVRRIMAMGIVDPARIGLIGHSFGGYETNYVISQTGLFAAAVSGAGLSDVVGSYFNLNENHSFTPDMWRYENQQQRMGKSLYDDKAGYLRNSPIMFADKINTPLLLWTGKSDRVVPMVQSTAMYLALRRLGKKTILLVYPNEGHTLGKPENQTDLTGRIASWFDYYLKDEKPADWIASGIGK